MQVVVASIAHRDLVTEEVVGSPRDDVRLTDGNACAARRAGVLLFGAMPGDIAHEPL